MLYFANTVCELSRGGTRRSMVSAMASKTIERVSVSRDERLSRHARVMLWLSRRALPPPVCPVAVERGIAVPAGDGAVLRADHYRPLAPGPHPTLLVRSPYGRGFPFDYIYGALFARQGYHVVFQSCRGTGGAGGGFEP